MDNGKIICNGQRKWGWNWTQRRIIKRMHNTTHLNTILIHNTRLFISKYLPCQKSCNISHFNHNIAFFDLFVRLSNTIGLPPTPSGRVRKTRTDTLTHRTPFSVITNLMVADTPASPYPFHCICPFFSVLFLFIYLCCSPLKIHVSLMLPLTPPLF